VRRQEYPADSAPAVGVMWQWSGDTAGQFHPYSTEVSSLLEKAHRCSASAVDLYRHPFYLPYVVRLSDMLQIRNDTNYRRRVQRVLLSQPYMPASSSFSHTAVSPLPAQVFQFGNTTAHTLPGIPATPAVDPSSLIFPSLFALPFVPPPLSPSSSAPAVGSPWVSGGLQGGSAAAVASSFVDSGNAAGQPPLFTIGQSPPSDGATRKKRTLIRNFSPNGR